MLPVHRGDRLRRETSTQRRTKIPTSVASTKRNKLQVLAFFLGKIFCFFCSSVAKEPAQSNTNIGESKFFAADRIPHLRPSQERTHPGCVLPHIMLAQSELYLGNFDQGTFVFVQMLDGMFQ